MLHGDDTATSPELACTHSLGRGEQMVYDVPRNRRAAVRLISEHCG